MAQQAPADGGCWPVYFYTDMIGRLELGLLIELLMLPDTFETARLMLRPITVVDVDAIFDSYAQDEAVARYLIWRPHRSRSETRAYVDRCIATPSEVERTYMLVGSRTMSSGVHLPSPSLRGRPLVRIRLQGESPDRLSAGQGLGFGQRILQELEAKAREFGLSTLRLETNQILKEAQALYRRCGYREVAPFNDEPYAHHWFEKTQ